jgi:uncharacterized protein (DUF983 family)
MTSPPMVSPVSAAVRGCCPRCGQGPLFRQVLNLRERCSGCGLDYKFIDTGDGPAVFVIFILGFLMMGSALWVEFTYEPPVWVHVVAWGLLTPLVALGLLRLIKGWLIGQQFKHKAEQGQLDQGR